MSFAPALHNSALEDFLLRQQEVYVPITITGSGTKSSIVVTSTNPAAFLYVDKGTAPTTSSLDSDVTFSTITSTSSTNPSIIGLVIPCGDAGTLLGCSLVTGIAGTNTPTAATYATASATNADGATTNKNLAVAVSLTGCYLNSASTTGTFTLKLTYLRKVGT